MQPAHKSMNKDVQMRVRPSQLASITSNLVLYIEIQYKEVGYNVETHLAGLDFCTFSCAKKNCITVICESVFPPLSTVKTFYQTLRKKVPENVCLGLVMVILFFTQSTTA